MIESRTLSQQAYSHLREQIIEGAYAAGQFLREVELAETLGISRTPIREALSQLANEGFVERIPRKGFRIPDDAVADIVELYPIVAALEAVAGRLALPHLSGEDLQALKALNVRLRRAVEEGASEDAVTINNEFHRLICERSGNRRLVTMLEDLRRQMRRLEAWFYSRPQHGERSVAEHSRLLEALGTGDAESVIRILENNMSLTSVVLQEEAGTAP